MVDLVNLVPMLVAQGNPDEEIVKVAKVVRKAQIIRGIVIGVGILIVTASILGGIAYAMVKIAKRNKAAAPVPPEEQTNPPRTI